MELLALYFGDFGGRRACFFFLGITTDAGVVLMSITKGVSGRLKAYTGRSRGTRSAHGRRERSKMLFAFFGNFIG